MGKDGPMPKSAESEVRGELEVLVSSLGLTNHTPHFRLTKGGAALLRSKPHTTLHHTRF